MFTTTRIAAVVSIVVLGSGLALSGLVVRPGDEAIGPPGAAAPLVGDDSGFFSGVRFGGSMAAGGERTVENGMEVRLGQRYTGGGLKTDEPRMNGTFAETNNGFSTAKGIPLPADATGGTIRSIRYVIENDGGTWTCETTALMVGDTESDTGWCTGAGDYAGLRAYLVIDGFNDVAGYITSGDGPPLPEASME